jgi:pyridoxine 4-dehydrogenase
LSDRSDAVATAGTFAIGGELVVNRVGLGTNRIRDDDASRRALRRAVELGINLIDTADVYTEQQSERTIGETLAPYREGLVVATKAGITIGPGSGRGVDASPAHLRRSLDGSLARLRLERVDLYYLHRVDPQVPLAESVSALRELQQAGKIRQIGLSSVSVAQLEEARRYAEIAAVQNAYSISERQHDDVVDYCTREGIAFVPYYPLRRAKLAERRRELEPLLRRYGATPAQLAIAWLLRRSPVVLPIPGTLSLDHLAENVAAATIALDAEDRRTLERLAR